MINRKKLVQKHNPVNKKADGYSPLSIGNGEFAFTADITGLQTFPEAYRDSIPLCTLSQWAWHSFSIPDDLKQKNLQLQKYKLDNREIGYKTKSKKQEKLYYYLRQNPHRLHLGKLGFIIKKANGEEVNINNIKNVNQELDLWSGILKSSFTVEGVPVKVTTGCHPVYDLLSISVESPLISKNRLKIIFEFPYASPDISAADWEHPEKHRTNIVKIEDKRCFSLARIIDKENYFCDIQFSNKQNINKKAPHSYIFHPQNESNKLELSCLFTSNKCREDFLPKPDKTFSKSKSHWKDYWKNGGIIKLSKSDDSRAVELERRIILSQYLTAIQCSGSLPPQETGLTCNSWNGKFHLEMHWWHSVHFVLWNKEKYLENSMWWYYSIIDRAKELAKSQGYEGARWPKMVGPQGEDSPSNVGPLIIWQQPHPIIYSELLYKTQPKKSTLRKYKELVFETAKFLASFVEYDENKDRYILPPPIAPLQENYNFKEVINPIFETEYWIYALSIAQKWRKRLDLKRKKKWDHIISKMSSLPQNDGVYLGHENAPDTYQKYKKDHPSMLTVYSMIPGKRVNKKIMERTLNKVLEEWEWDTAWGWDFPITAITAARLGKHEIAIDSLLMDTPKNTFLPNGHNWQREDLPVYLPGNGALLMAIVMILNISGFPDNWVVNWEDLNLQLQ